MEGSRTYYTRAYERQYDRMYSTSSLKSIARSNFFKLRTGKNRENNQNHFERSLEDLAILFRAFLTCVPPFQSYRGFKTLERSIETASTKGFLIKNHNSEIIIKRLALKVYS